MKSILISYSLDFVCRDLVIVVGDTLEKARKKAQKHLGIRVKANRVKTSDAMVIFRGKYPTIMLFKYSSLSYATICHEVTHATNSMFEYIGIHLNYASDEAYAYHNDMLFRLVAEFLREHKIKVPALPRLQYLKKPGKKKAKKAAK